MVMFSIIQLGFTRFLTDRKERIYLPPLRYICVCGVWWGTRHRGEYFGFLAAILDFVAQKKCNAPPPYAHRPDIAAPERLDWVQMWVQQSGLMPICPGNQAHFRHEVVGLLTPCLYVRGVHALPFDCQFRLALCLNLGRVAKLGQSGESYTAVGIAIAGGVKGLQLDAVAHTCEDSRVTLYISTTITIITLSSIYVIFALSVQ